MHTTTDIHTHTHTHNPHRKAQTSGKEDIPQGQKSWLWPLTSKPRCPVNTLSAEQVQSESERACHSCVGTGGKQVRAFPGAGTMHREGSSAKTRATPCRGQRAVHHTKRCPLLGDIGRCQPEPNRSSQKPCSFAPSHSLLLNDHIGKL